MLSLSDTMVATTEYVIDKPR